MNSIESLILYSLIKDESYTRKALPFLSERYFSTKKERMIYEYVKKYFDKYNSTPTLEVLTLSISEASGITDQEESDILQYLNDIIGEVKTDHISEDWLVDETEKFCQERAVHNAILDSINILNGENKKLDKGAIPNILSEALAVSFDTNVGHDYVNDSELRYDFYHKKEKKVPFDIESLNKITKGGFSSKTLAIWAASTGVGKSLVMCHLAAANLSLGNNVLYITLEMAEERIAERIDANLLDINISEIEEIPKQLYERKVEKMKQSVSGRLIIKEYPTASANVNHFRALLDELKLKKNFTPDIIYVDYLNIAASARLRMSNTVNSYTYIKSIAEEFRGMAVEYEVPVVSATQINRSGSANTDLSMTDTSESFGLPMTADFMAGIVSTEDMQERGQFLFKQLKNRYVDPTFMKRFMVGVDYSKMRLYELENPLDGLYENEDKEEEQPQRSRRSKGKGRFADFDF